MAPPTIGPPGGRRPGGVPPTPHRSVDFHTFGENFLKYSITKATMDPFGYHAANGNNYAVDGYSPHRDELAELQRRLRARYSRRRLIRRGDVEDVIREMRWPPEGGQSARRFTPATQPRVEIDLTCDEVIE